MKNISKLAGVVLLYSIILAGCQEVAAPTPNVNSTPQPNSNTAAPVNTNSVTQNNTNTVIGMANPASVNCTTKGGTLEIRQDGSGGQYGVCLFEDNRQCEEWALFNGDSRSVV